MAVASHTPLVFVLQDDTQMIPPVDTHALYKLLGPSLGRASVTDSAPAPPVEYIKFYMYPDCMVNPMVPDGKYRLLQGANPCKPHPVSSLLQQSTLWQDRPHFATRALYERRVFATLPPDVKVTPEQFLDTQNRSEAALRMTWGLWTYGRRGDMLRELHAPVPVDGELITREFVVAMKKHGVAINISVPYVHSYLVHAYAGKSQAFEDNRRTLRYRTKNPTWMREDDKRWGGLRLRR